ncbi:hypothetical protein [Polaromonas sp.]|uniref:hypothetical protein n=1 Tax=Polaromonas sp. TaxID=1869339 RepID=UPI0013B86048|nr:hypothetical protein [Polaromonas sp.]NDP64787.1 hypothetical protein [Polaromonas sp.]
MAKPVGTKNRTPAEIKRDAELDLAKAKVKILEAKKKQEVEAKRVAQKKAAEATIQKKSKGK